MKLLCRGEGFLSEYFLTAAIIIVCIIVLGIFIGFGSNFSKEVVIDILWLISPILLISITGILIIIILKKRT